MTAPDLWQEYRRGLDRLGRIRREAATAASATADETPVIDGLRGELSVLRGRLTGQRPHVVAALNRARLPASTLIPDPRDVAASQAATTGPAGIGDPAAVSVALRGARANLDAAYAALSTMDGDRQRPLAHWPPALRNLLVYGAAALGGIVPPLFLYALTPGNTWTLLAVAGLIVLPLGGFAIAYATVATLFRDTRTPIIGAAVTVMTIIVGAALMVVGF